MTTRNNIVIGSCFKIWDFPADTPDRTAIYIYIYPVSPTLCSMLFFLYIQVTALYEEFRVWKHGLDAKTDYVSVSHYQRVEDFCPCKS